MKIYYGRNVGYFKRGQFVQRDKTSLAKNDISNIPPPPFDPSLKDGSSRGNASKQIIVFSILVRHLTAGLRLFIPET
jgi:hypothetical protein